MIISGISSESVQSVLIWYFDKNKRHPLGLSLLMSSEITTELITFNHLSCHSSSTVKEIEVFELKLIEI